MTVTCAICQKSMSSMIVGNPNAALTEINEKVQKHTLAKHPELVKEIGNRFRVISSLLPWLLMATFAIDWDEELEPIITKAFETNQNKIAEQLDWELSSDDDEEDEEGGDDEDDGPSEDDGNNGDGPEEVIVEEVVTEVEEGNEEGLKPELVA